jgi:capsular polysaccharide biosynthesis protein
VPDSGEQRFRVHATSRIGPVSPTASDATARLLAEPGYGDDLRDYLAPLTHSWKLLALVTALATFAAFAGSRYELAPWYQAFAIIKPMTPQQTAGHLQGVLGSPNLGMFSDLVGSQYNSDAAEEYITILTSFSFVTAMVERHNLELEVVPRGKSYPGPDGRQWAVYRIILARMRCEYSVKNSSITLNFEDPSRERAQRILGYEIDDLREKLRSREVRNAADAVASLNQQVNKISDSLLSHQVYDLIATQIQRQHLAEIEADFAFIVLQPPVAPDLPVWPRTLVNAFLGGFIAMVLASIVILALNALHESRYRKPFPSDPPRRKSAF